MKYFSELIGTDQPPKPITEAEALDKVLGTFRDCDEVRDWLTIPNCIVCRYSTVYVVSDVDDGWTPALLLLRGTESRTDVRYDDLGDRV